MEEAKSTLQQSNNLRDELVKTIGYHRRWARFYEHLTSFMLTGALIASAVAGVWGLLGWNGKVAGGIALIPSLIAYFAVTLKPDGRARWHHSFKNDLNALRRRLVYQMPNPPTADQIALIAEEWTMLDGKVHKEAPKYFSPNWAVFSRHKLPSSLDENSSSH